VTVTPPAFTHRDPGTAESVWWSAREWDDVPTLDISAIAARYRNVLIVSAHPDDETLGAGGLMTDLADLGVSITVAVATAGEKCQPNLSTSQQQRMAVRRRREVEQAIGGLTSQARLVHFELPDGDLALHEPHLCREITELSGADTLILAPWTGDGHADHDALGRAAIAASHANGSAIAHFPIWLWHWGTPDMLAWEHLVAAETSLVGCWRKRGAVGAFTSQLHPTNGGQAEADVPPIIGASMRARSRRLVEVFIDEHHALPVFSPSHHTQLHLDRSDRFDDMYDDGPDPWKNVGSFYEKRRRELILAMLGSARYARVLELGCADGFLTAALVARADTVLAFDTSRRAVAAARVNAPAATVERGDLPDLLSDAAVQRFDLIVLSEVGYFLTATELLATLRRARAALNPAGELVLCHWQHPTHRVPLDGVLVHEQARDFMGVEPRAKHRDGDLRIDIWGDAPSVAALEGRV